MTSQNFHKVLAQTPYFISGNNFCLSIFKLYRQLYKIDELLDEENAILIYSALNNHPPKTNWPKQLKSLLVWLILKLYANLSFSIQKIPNHIWTIVARVLKRTIQDVKYKWLSFSNKSILQSPWTQEEDNLLVSIINQFSKVKKQNHWRQISLKLSKYNKSQTLRLGKHCRERWHNHLNRDIDRTPWDIKECMEVLNLVKQNGKKWSKIAKIMERNENQVKNKYNGLMRQQFSIDEVQNKLRKKIFNEGQFFESQEMPKEIDITLNYGLVNLTTQELYIVDREQLVQILKIQQINQFNQQVLEENSQEISNCSINNVFDQ